MEGYLPRTVDAQLTGLLAELPAIAIDGPKAVGKTESARRLAGTTVMLDEPGTRAVAEADPRALLVGTPPVLLDEWQLVPAVFDAVRRSVDDDPSAGRFLLTGSARPASLPAHTGAGRIVPVRMRPLAVAERPGQATTVSLGTLLEGEAAPVAGRSSSRLAEYAEHIVRSGLPGVQHLGDHARTAILEGYVEQIVQHDVAAAGHELRRPETLRRWLSAYAAAVGTVCSLETLRDTATAGDGSTPAKTTVLTYQEVLQRLWLVDDVPGWSPSRSALTKLGQAPKRHLADPALATTLLGVDATGLLRDGALFGRLFESLATLCVRVAVEGRGVRVHHLRTHGGEREVDLILERRDGRVLAIEVKLGAQVDDHDTAHLRWLRDRLGDRVLDAVVLHTGEVAYRRADGTAVVPLALLGP